MAVHGERRAMQPCGPRPRVFCAVWGASARIAAADHT